MPDITDDDVEIIAKKLYRRGRHRISIRAWMSSD
jgi:hypothetical protein